MTTKEAVQTESAEQRALQRLVAQEVAKEAEVQLEQRRRQRQQEQLAQQVETATQEFESRLAVLRERMAAVTQRQTEWRQRFESLLNEMDALSDSQPQIQREIAAVITECRQAHFDARQKGAMVSNSEQAAIDSIGGDSADLWPWPDGISTNRVAPATVANGIATDIYSGSCYRPDYSIDGRKR